MVSITSVWCVTACSVLFSTVMLLPWVWESSEDKLMFVHSHLGFFIESRNRFWSILMLLDVFYSIYWWETWWSIRSFYTILNHVLIVKILRQKWHNFRVLGDLEPISFESICLEKFKLKTEWEIIDISMRIVEWNSFLLYSVIRIMKCLQGEILTSTHISIVCSWG